MRGEFGAVWEEVRAEIWQPVIEHELGKSDLFSELFRAAVEADALKLKLTPEQLADMLDEPGSGTELFNLLQAGDFQGERGLATFMEKAFDVVEEYAGDALSNVYFVLLERFIQKYSLRYDLRRPCVLSPTLPGIFAGLVQQLRTLTSTDAHLTGLMNDFESAIRDLKVDSSDARIKTCIQKQFNLIEAISSSSPGVTTNTLGAMCDQIASWPHAEVKDAVKRVYKFANDYPGIRHGGTPANALRQIDVRDLVAVTVVMVGFAPYLAHQLSSDDVYRGASV